MHKVKQSPRNRAVEDWHRMLNANSYAANIMPIRQPLKKATVWQPKVITLVSYPEMQKKDADHNKSSILDTQQHMSPKFGPERGSGLGDEYGRMMNEVPIARVEVKKIKLQQRDTSNLGRTSKARKHQTGSPNADVLDEIYNTTPAQNQNNMQSLYERS